MKHVDFSDVVEVLNLEHKCWKEGYGYDDFVIFESSVNWFGQSKVRTDDFLRLLNKMKKEGYRFVFGSPDGVNFAFEYVGAHNDG